MVFKGGDQVGAQSGFSEVYGYLLYTLTGNDQFKPGRSVDRGYVSRSVPVSVDNAGSDHFDAG